MPPKGYRGITLPMELIEEIENLIEKHPELGYTSLAEFVKDAIRSKLFDLKSELEQEKNQI
ncbi:MAG: ribbon-helix-helix domain-containing protein [Archaeoglobaceae archaeon]|nr:ribbon-helix-helix domain-containing protein [Archaeoglobaceae archaeon]